MKKGKNFWDMVDRLGQLSHVSKPKPVPRPKLVEEEPRRLSKKTLDWAKGITDGN